MKIMTKQNYSKLKLKTGIKWTGVLSHYEIMVLKNFLSVAIILQIMRCLKNI